MCPIDPIVEYSRMHVPSLSSGCEIAQFVVRYIGYNKLRVSAIVCVFRSQATIFDRCVKV